MRAQEAIDRLCAVLENAAEIDWIGLRRRVQPGFISSGEVADFNLEGVTIWRESQDAWRPVRRLLVLGFVQGQYPTPPVTHAVFSADELQSLRDHWNVALQTPADQLADNRARLRRQLINVSDSVTFLVSRRDFAGAAQSFSDSLIFMHPWFTGAQEAQDRVLDIEANHLRDAVAFLALAAPAEASPPIRKPPRDLRFDRDLRELGPTQDGGPRPESPSSLETLMVSPLAWLLRRLNAEPPDGWAPEQVDPRLLGMLAHAVFEQVFSPNQPLPEPDDLESRTGTALESALRKRAPFLLTRRWEIECRHLESGLLRAASAWGNVLKSLDAEILAGEIWLQGTWDGTPIHGQADLVVELPDRRLLVVDYKRSKSVDRRQQMEKGYDSQANLYRIMLETGGPKNESGSTLAERLRDRGSIGTVYYMMNDQTPLADTRVANAGNIPNWTTLENNVSEAAMDLIGEKLKELRAGEVRLNRMDDREFFRKQAGLKPYALDKSPLIALFTVSDPDAKTSPTESP